MLKYERSGENGLWVLSKGSLVIVNLKGFEEISKSLTRIANALEKQIHINIDQYILIHTYF